MLTIRLSGTCRPSSLLKERPLKSEAQSIIINLFEVKPEFSQVGEAPLCNNTVARLRAGSSEISKSRLGCAAPRRSISAAKHINAARSHCSSVTAKRRIASNHSLIRCDSSPTNRSEVEPFCGAKGKSIPLRVANCIMASDPNYRALRRATPSSKRLIDSPYRRRGPIIT